LVGFLFGVGVFNGQDDIGETVADASHRIRVQALDDAGLSLSGQGQQLEWRGDEALPAV
jgi:hypothetical protein